MATPQESSAESGAVRVSRTDDNAGPRHSETAREHPGDPGATVAATDRRAVVEREKRRYGGIKWGSAFFGWLTATGTAVLLIGVLAAAGAAVGVSRGTDADEAADQAAGNAGTVSVIGGIALLVVLLIAYYCGGYVAGRMSRFDGVKQGIAVWVWGVVIAVLVAVGAAVLGAEFDILADVGAFPRLPFNTGDLTTGGIVAGVAAVVAALVGAILGGLAGMRFHRRVDQAGLGH